MNHWNNIYKKDGKKYSYYNILEPHQDMDRIKKIFKKHGAKKVLDLGCGAGRQAWYLVKNGFDVYGLDISEAGIKIARKILHQKGLKANLRVWNIFSKLPYKDDFFDAVVSVQVLQHGKEIKIKKAIKEIKRVLRPTGLIFITLSGRYSRGKVRPFLVKTATKVAPRTYRPTQGQETGLIHYIFNKRQIKKHFKEFEFLKFWKDKKDYYCLVGQSKKT